ncbi:hypothetical protein CLIB1423_03S04434 [[Candida] railenensis]|uniref:Uncharacterized protein n=1 Tax=[Candida] railenensis TaxID=45579 RepID=A0A9P0QLG1_9ASCO|nr:hypothetical protein CLIB1423_03S04434 [[Candida] railenensis]
MIIGENSRALMEKLAKSNTSSLLPIWDQLTQQNGNHERLQALSSNSKPLPSSSIYYNFLKHLYPNSTLISSYATGDAIDPSKKYSKINHDNLFDAYQKLPSPRPLFMKPNHLEDLLKVFLERRDFKYGHPILNSKADVSRGRLIAVFKETLANRKKHVERCSSIMNDIRKADLPLSMGERNKLIAMSLFRDREDILEKVQLALDQQELHSRHVRALSQRGKSLNLTKFEWDGYQSLLQSFGEDISTETYNTILFAAIRHGNQKIVEDIYSRLFSDEPKGDRKSLGLFLEYFASQKKEERFIKLIEICSTYVKLDSQTLDIVIAGLLTFNDVELAESLVKSVYLECYDESCSASQNLVVYKILSVEDELIYRDMLYKYDKVSELLSGSNIPQFKLFPTENTFFKFIQYYTSNPGHIHKIGPLLSTMESQFKLPITSRIYKQLFQHTSTFENVQRLTMDLLKDYELSSHSSNEAVVEKLGSLPLTPKLKVLLQNSQNPVANLPSYLNNDRMSTVKLSKDLMNTIFEAYSRSFRSKQIDMVEKIQKLRGELQSKEAVLWGNVSSKSIDNLKEAKFLRKAYLIELLDIGFSVEDSD